MPGLRSPDTLEQFVLVALQQEVEVDITDELGAELVDRKMECMSQDDIGGRQPVTTDAIMFEPLAPAPHAIVVDPGADALPKAAVRLDVNATDENRNFVMAGRKA